MISRFLLSFWSKPEAYDGDTGTPYCTAFITIYPGSSSLGHAKGSRGGIQGAGKVVMFLDLSICFLISTNIECEDRGAVILSFQFLRPTVRKVL
jgi:hypothetical protein